MAAVQRNPKDSMKSTWRLDKSQWGIAHHFLHFLNVYHANLNEDVPVHDKSEPIPYLDSVSVNLWVLVHAAWPMLIQHVVFLYTGHNISPLAAFLLYSFAFQFNAIRQVRLLRNIGHKIGFLDGDKHTRDEVPDVGVRKALLSLLWTTNVRPLFTLMFTYDSTKPVQMSWWLPLELFLYSVVLDFFFYSYHRACHEIDFLWRYHRTHHLTKHPNPMLSAYADTEQEIIEIAIVPILTYLTLKSFGLPMGFYDWWICHEFIIFSEAFGHSGLRMYAIPPGVSNWVLKMFGCELLIEDHDLHHRKGWRQSHNYGKQTRLWDRVFGTCGPRIESDVSNIDYNQKITMPFF